MNIIRSASTMNCSVWLLISRVSKAAAVTAAMARASAGTSLRMTIFGFGCFLCPSPGAQGFRRRSWRVR